MQSYRRATMPLNNKPCYTGTNIVDIHRSLLQHS